MLPASGIVCTVHRLAVLRQERLMLAIRREAEDALRVERILLLGVERQQDDAARRTVTRSSQGDLARL